MGVLSKSSSTTTIHQLLPWYCFHLPSSSRSTTTNSSTNSNSSSPAVRLIASDGRVKLFKHPVPASELIRQHPLHLICRSDSFFIGQKVPALPPSEHLQPGHSYFLLPSHFFHSALSFVTLSSSLIKKDCSTAAILWSFDIRKTEKGMLQMRVKDEMMIAAEDKCVDTNEGEDNEKKRSRVCSNEELEKEYRQLVGCRARRWKPRLGTLTETSLKSRRGCW